MSLQITVLGCGSSAGVPRVGTGWGACDPNNPKNRRRRCSILVERSGLDGATTVLVDTSPDLREQLLASQTTRLDAVLITHDHADHTHGIDDLRPIAGHMRRRIPVYADAATGSVLETRFGYCFETPPGSDYPPILERRLVQPGKAVVVDGPGGSLTALPFRMIHGSSDATGFRFGAMAYAPDVNRMPAESLPSLEGLDLLIVDALRDAPHPSHFTVAEALGLIEQARPKRAVLTNLATDLDYEALRSRLPPHVEPAYDGMRLTVEADSANPL
jgi:phosphoribosyl 1,2-cyclic phosphate phosphodiesterase